MINQKIYIGQTIDPTRRWYEHRRNAATPTQTISYAIQKHGAQNFLYEVIATCRVAVDANAAEELCIQQHNSMAGTGHGYNVAVGGMNAPRTESWKENISKAQAGYHNSPATEFKVGQNKGKDTWMKGKKHSSEARKKISDAMKRRAVGKVA